MYFYAFSHVYKTCKDTRSQLGTRRRQIPPPLEHFGRPSRFALPHIETDSSSSLCQSFPSRSSFRRARECYQHDSLRTGCPANPRRRCFSLVRSFRPRSCSAASFSARRCCFPARLLDASILDRRTRTHRRSTRGGPYCTPLPSSTLSLDATLNTMGRSCGKRSPSSRRKRLRRSQPTWTRRMRSPTRCGPSLARWACSASRSARTMEDSGKGAFPARTGGSGGQDLD